MPLPPLQQLQVSMTYSIWGSTNGQVGKILWIPIYIYSVHTYTKNREGWRITGGGMEVRGPLSSSAAEPNLRVNHGFRGSPTTLLPAALSQARDLSRVYLYIDLLI